MPRNADCFQLDELCCEQCVRPWVNSNAGDVIIKLWTWKLHGNSIGLTKQGRILYAGYLGLKPKFHIYLKYRSSNWKWAKAVFGTCLCTCGERLALSLPTTILCYRTLCGQPKGWLEEQSKTYIYQRLLFSIMTWKSWKTWVSPASRASQ